MLCYAERNTIDRGEEHHMKRLSVLIMILMMTMLTQAQELDQTFVSRFEGNLTFKYPSDWMVYEDENEFLVVVSREPISSSDPVEAGQAALIFLTPQGFEAAGMTVTNVDDALDEFMGEMPEDAEESEFLSEYGRGFRFDFALSDELDFTIIGLNHNEMPLLAIMGLNQPDPDDVDTLVEVVKTARYGGDPELITDEPIDDTQLIERDGYRFSVPADWIEFEADVSFEIPGEFYTVATVLLIDESMTINPDEAVTFESVIQDELELLAEDFADDTGVVVEDGEPINGFPTQEVLMTLEHEDAIDFEYRFVLVDYEDDKVFLSAIYTEEPGTTADDLSSLREIAESVEFTGSLELGGVVEHAGLRLSYPEGFEAFTGSPTIIRLLETESNARARVVEIANPSQTLEWYPTAANGDGFEVAEVIAETYEMTADDITEVELANGRSAWHFTLVNDPLNLAVVTMAVDGGVVSMTMSYVGNNHAQMTDLLLLMASDLEVIAD